MTIENSAEKVRNLIFFVNLANGTKFPEKCSKLLNKVFSHTEEQNFNRKTLISENFYFFLKSNKTS